MALKKIEEGLVKKICVDCGEEHAVPKDKEICLGCMFRRGKNYEIKEYK